MKQKVCAFLLCLLFMQGAIAVGAAQLVRVRVTGEGEQAQLIFDFPKLVGYRTTQKPNGIEITFLTPLGSAKPVRFPDAITSFDVTRPEDGHLHVMIGMKQGLISKVTRLERQVVVDISQKSSLEKETGNLGEKETKEPQSASDVSLESVAKALTPSTSTPTSSIMIDTAPVQVVQREPPLQESDMTKISLSTMTPRSLAVFQRFGYLWIVTNSEMSAAFLPQAQGSQAGFMGRAQVFKFEAGKAWRFAMPPQNFVSIRKHKVGWDIILSLRPDPDLIPSMDAAIDVDPGSEKARLMAHLPGADTVLNLQDPIAGDMLYVVLTKQENMRVSQSRRFIDIEILGAHMGMVVRPLRDHIQTQLLNGYVQVIAPSGLLVTDHALSGVLAVGQTQEETGQWPSLFDFSAWRPGPETNFVQRQQELAKKAAQATSPDERQAGLMQLARLFFSFGFGPETLGILRIVRDENPDVEETPDFKAMRGAARVLAGQYEEALQDLSSPSLSQHPEVGLWTGYAAAASEQWHKANRVFPENNHGLIRYPNEIAVPITLYMAESALRLGHSDSAETLLDSLSTLSLEKSARAQAAIGYLKGEAARQRGDLEKALSYWTPVAVGPDRLYHAKASLAQTNLQLQQGKITKKQAIDAIDALRFAWRGDGLEVQILTRLGELEVEDGQYLAGLRHLTAAADLADGLQEDSSAIRGMIIQTFKDLFVHEADKKISPLEAVSLYTEFSNLLPPGPESVAASLHFVDDLIQMDLLDKAGKVLEDHLKSGVLPPRQRENVILRLAALRLLDAKPAAALSLLEKTTALGSVQGSDESFLLQARALSQINRTDDALDVLSRVHSKDADKLKVDILWRAQRWKSAAVALEPFLPRSTVPLDGPAANIVLNMAVAAKLGNDLDRIDDLRARYDSGMEKGPLAGAFKVVTRQIDPALLSDRETLMKMAGEVDMFKGFLESYRKIDKK